MDFAESGQDTSRLRDMIYDDKEDVLLVQRRDVLLSAG